MHALKVWLSARGWFPTFSICAHCKRIMGVRWGVAHFIPGHWFELSHGICNKCGPALYGKFWGDL